MTSFLEFNGWSVPVVGGQREPLIIGDEGRTFDGGKFRDRRVVKDRLLFQTRVIRELEAMALEGLIQGFGEVFRYNSDLYSGKGLAPETGTVGAVRLGVPGDGSSILDENGNTESKFGAGALSIDGATTNILGADSRDAENAPTGFTAEGGATISGDTTHFVQGTTSLKTTGLFVSHGFRTNAVSASGATAYVGHLYLKRNGGHNAFNVRLRDDVGTIATKTFTLTNDLTWYRIEVTGTSDVAATAIDIQVTPTLNSAFEIYADALQIQTGSVATTWVDGTRAAGDLEYSADLLTSKRSVTISAWVRMPTANPAADVTIFHAKESTATNKFTLSRPNGLNRLRLEMTGPAGTSTSINPSTPNPWDGDWHHVAAVLTYADDVNRENRAEIFVDGVSSGSLTNRAEFPDLTKIATISVGSIEGNEPLNEALIDEFLILPYAAPSALISALANQTSAVPLLPKIRVTGNLLQEFDQGLEMEGELASESYIGHQSSDGWMNQSRSVSFSLEEA